MTLMSGSILIFCFTPLKPNGNLKMWVVIGRLRWLLLSFFFLYWWPQAWSLPRGPSSPLPKGGCPTQRMKADDNGFPWSSTHRLSTITPLLAGTASRNILAFVQKPISGRKWREWEILTNSKRPPQPIHPIIVRIRLMMLSILLQWVKQCQRADRAVTCTMGVREREHQQNKRNQLGPYMVISCLNWAYPASWPRYGLKWNLNF